jgi:hypothetical protein
MLRSKLWRIRSTNWIALTAGLSWAFVDRLRQRLGGRPARVEAANGRIVTAQHRRKEYRYGR